MIVLYRFKLIFKIISISGFLALVYYARSLFVPQAIRIHNSLAYAQHVQDQINHMLNKKAPTRLSARQIYTELQAIEKSVAAIKIVHLPSQVSHVFITAAYPEIIIKDMLKNVEYVLAHNQAVISRDTYIQNLLEGLETVYIESVDFLGEVTAEDFKKNIRQISPEIFTHYTVIWHSKTEILLVHKQAKLHIICDSNSILNAELIKYAELIYAQKKINLKIDIRFKDILVCTPEGGDK